ncbi:MAG: formamidopyrimidine-DNA glycosylase [Planctomycetota bacterium]|nr:formamidopyrimidine-DNA glycosylase [Planctomycetota bacterium]
MPELPDVTIYLEALRARILGRTLERLRIASPFLVRSVDPPVFRAEGRRVAGLLRLGKRIAFALDGDLFLVLHLMIAGRLRWDERAGPAAKRPAIPGKIGLAAFDFEHGTLFLTEASSKKRASLYLVQGEEQLAYHRPPGLELFEADARAFAEVLARENHTLKRALTDPRLFSGIGNAYGDEILHAAGLSPVRQTKTLKPGEIERLFEAARGTLARWTEKLRADFAGRFPGAGEITAFRPDFAVHGKYGKPCPACGTKVQRIRYAENETNYCPRCQTGGKLLADRSLSRLLKSDWPKTVEELEERR